MICSKSSSLFGLGLVLAAAASTASAEPRRSSRGREASIRGQGSAVVAGMVLPLPEGLPWSKSRFISFGVDTELAEGLTAIRVELTDLYGVKVCCEPGNPESCTASDCQTDQTCSGFATFTSCTDRFISHEGQVRYVNSFEGVTTCPDSPTFGTTYRCATLGCQPEYRDWGAELGGAVLHVTGNAVVPVSTYAVQIIDESCGQAPEADDCQAASVALNISTTRYGDAGSQGGAPPDGINNVIDVGCVLNKMKEAPPFSAERYNWMKEEFPDPVNDPINVVDLGHSINGCKGVPFMHSISTCP